MSTDQPVSQSKRERESDGQDRKPYACMFIPGRQVPAGGSGRQADWFLASIRVLFISP